MGNAVDAPCKACEQQKAETCSTLPCLSDQKQKVDRSAPAAQKTVLSIAEENRAPGHSDYPVASTGGTQEDPSILPQPPAATHAVRVAALDSPTKVRSSTAHDGMVPAMSLSADTSAPKDDVALYAGSMNGARDTENSSEFNNGSSAQWGVQLSPPPPPESTEGRRSTKESARYEERRPPPVSIPEEKDTLRGQPIRPTVSWTEQVVETAEVKPEEPDNHDPYVERIKMITSCILVAVFFGALLFFGITKRNEEATCSPESTSTEDEGEELLMCYPCGSGGLLLPLAGDWEQAVNTTIRIVIYFIGLMWCFIGIAIVCDQFMAAIEEVTSTERIIWLEVDGTKQQLGVKVWNDTVANLTLMALGSSAPEILLSVIEILGNKMFSGRLGPSTIVGSAAFNLLVIIAVCISAIPTGELRKIKEMDVFIVTCSFSLLAYLWILVMLQIVTPHLVEPWEAVVTFAGFPVLVILAFMADKGMISFTSKAEEQPAEQRPDTAENAGRRLSARRSLMPGGARPSHVAPSDAKPCYSRASVRRSIMQRATGQGPGLLGKGPNGLVFGFKQTDYVVLQRDGSLRVTVVANKKPECAAELWFKTVQGSAWAGKRYKHSSGKLHFQPHELERPIDIPILNNDGLSDEEYFTIELYDLSCDGASAKLGDRSAKAVILTSEKPGVLGFANDEVAVSEGSSAVEFIVLRKSGACGSVSCGYVTEDLTAVAGIDYARSEGTLHFKEGETQSSIHVDLLRAGQYKGHEKFRIVLSGPGGGAMFDTNASVCVAALPASLTESGQGMSDWADQFAQAVYCNGTPEEQAGASPSDWCFHLISLFWKVLCAFIPPPVFLGGWGCFGCSLVMIGGFTALVGDMAALLGCCIGIPEEICAVTLVALGTSLPDTFASKVSAVEEDTADNSVGNVTGSNSVNVFLGLGLPWTIAAFYWDDAGPNEAWLKYRLPDGSTYRQEYLSTYPKGGFMVPAGSLGFSVMVFSGCVLCAVALLVFRRKAYGGELGGPDGPKKLHSAALVLLWFSYIGASIWRFMS